MLSNRPYLYQISDKVLAPLHAESWLLHIGVIKFVKPVLVFSNVLTVLSIFGIANWALTLLLLLLLLSNFVHIT
jgi:hypothetical protein